MHRSYEHLLPVAVPNATPAVPDGFNYTVVKYQLKTETVSFIVCDDFDSTDEPTVGNVCTVKSDGATTIRRQSKDPWIYHHKWLFVADDYAGFDVAAAKTRSMQWLSLDNIDFRRIGKKSYWEEHILPRLKDVSA
ncbi:MAG: hypothetical protein ABGZ23_15345 [Fuerstiella sp.]|nr:hypothetical protein [Fuerstiella sp.]